MSQDNGGSFANGDSMGNGNAPEPHANVSSGTVRDQANDLRGIAITRFPWITDWRHSPNWG
jgi:hypothetical protein